MSLPLRPTDIKGAKNGKCNITACTDKGPAIHYNETMSAWYCTSCALSLNENHERYGDPILCDWPTKEDMVDDPNYVCELRK